MLRCPRYALARNGVARVTCIYRCNSVFSKCAEDFCLSKGKVLKAEGLLEAKGNCVTVKRGKGKGVVKLELPSGKYVIGKNVIKVIEGKPVDYVEEDDALYVMTSGGLVKISCASLSGVLQETWAFKADGRVNCVSYGNFLAVSSECAQVLSKESVVARRCWNEVPWGCDARGDVYAFAFDYFVSVYKRGMWEEYYVGHDFGNSVTLVDGGFIACWDKCGLFDGGTALWKRDVGIVRGRVSVIDGLAYVPDHKLGRVWVVDVGRGSVVRELKFKGGVNWTYSRDDLLAVASEEGLFLYEGARLLWSVKGSFATVAISPKGKFVAASDGRKLYVFNEEGFKLDEAEFSSRITAIDWGEELVVGLARGEVISAAFPAKKEEVLVLEEVLL